MSSRTATVGWDVGGAHLKFTQVDADGEIVTVRQLPCPLWRGVVQVNNAFNIALPLLRGPCVHAVTMTGELSDVFTDRDQGVAMLTDCIQSLLGEDTLFFAGPQGLIPATDVGKVKASVASANWLATGKFLAQQQRDCLLIDIGSTTCDLLRIRDGQVSARGSTDADRLRFGELIYTGAVRTPIRAVVSEVPFAGEWQAIVAERFAVTGDVYRLTGELTTEMLNRYVHFDAADGGGHALADCARRLARMLGYDFHEEQLPDWQRTATYIADCHVEFIMRSLWRILTLDPATIELPLIAAGTGRFLVRRIGQRLGRPVLDLSDLVHGSAENRDYAAVCAPATALAYLLRDSLHA